MFPIADRVDESVRAKNVVIGLELPELGAYRKTQIIVEFISKLGLRLVDLHGCTFNFRAQYGPRRVELIGKPYMVATDSPYVFDELSRRGSHDRVHAKLEGRDTTVSENYTPELAAVVHKALHVIMAV